MRTSSLSVLLKVVILSACVCSFGSCGKESVPPKGPNWLDDEGEEEKAPEPKKAAVSPLDSYGNLKGRGEMVFGFERPYASREADRRSKVPVYYLMANEERMLRFFRSRGHVVIETSTGWRFQHSSRTLKVLGEDSEVFKDARIYARQGPGAGWTLIYDDGKPIQTAKLPLIELIERVQKPESPAKKDASAKAATSAPPGKAGGSNRSGTSSITHSELRKLERAALQRDFNRRRAKDVSARIYKHTKKRGARFLD